MAEPIYGTGVKRKPGKRRGYGKQQPKKTVVATTDAADRRKAALATLARETNARTLQASAMASQTRSTIASASSASMAATGMLSGIASPAVLGQLRDASKLPSPVNGHGLGARILRSNNIKGVARKLEGAGYSVGSLEGFQGQGQITSGHVANSEHYEGRAMDITGPRLGHLARILDRIYNLDVTHKAYGGHGSHIHLGYEGKRNLNPDEFIYDPYGYSFK